MSGEHQRRIIRLCLDVNIIISALIATGKGSRNTATQALVRIVEAGHSEAGLVQLVIGHRMLVGIERVCQAALGLTAHQAAREVALLKTIAALGPAGDPPFAVAGGGVLPVMDTEDRGVLECAIAGNADILATRNMGDFLTKDMEIVTEGELHILPRPGADALFIMRPDVAVAHLRAGALPPAARP